MLTLDRQNNRGEESRRFIMKHLKKTGILMAMILVIGCSNSYTIRRYDGLTLRNKAIIETKAGGQILVSKAIVKQDSVFATEFPSGQNVILPASDIIRIVQKKNDALKLAAIGAAGVVAWVVMTADEWNDDDNSGYTYFWSAILAVPAGGTGYLVGSFHQYEYSILFESNEKTAELQAIP